MDLKLLRSGLSMRPEKGGMAVAQAPHRLVGRCPVCGGTLQVRRLECEHCGSALEGRFHLCRFCQLSREQQEFIEVFLACRGNIREVERVLGISYPTVRNRLDGIIEALDLRAPEREAARSSQQRRLVLEALERGELTVAEALQRLRGEAGRPGGEGPAGATGAATAGQAAARPGRPSVSVGGGQAGPGGFGSGERGGDPAQEGQEGTQP